MGQSRGIVFGKLFDIGMVVVGVLLLTLNLGVGSAARTADALERYSDRFPASKAQIAAEFVGNPDLKPERSTQGDVWLEGNFEKVTVQASVFVRGVDNYITLTPTTLARSSRVLPPRLRRRRDECHLVLSRTAMKSPGARARI